MKELFEILLQRLGHAERIVFLGIGEVRMSDDGVGPYIISELLNKQNDKILFINAKIDPMARMDEINNFSPSHLVVIDTCSLNKEPGTVSIIEREKMMNLVPISSHTVPIHIIIDLILENLPELDVFMLGIVPENLDGIYDLNQYKENELSIEELNANKDLPFFSIELTDRVKKTADTLIKIIKDLIKEI